MRRIVVALSSLVFFFGFGNASAALGPPAITAPEAVIIDGWSGVVLFAKNSDVEREPASTVKIMTALVVLERKLGLRTVVTVSPYATSYGGSTAGLYPDERITVWNLLHGMLMPSGNDAAIALSLAVSGSTGGFVAAMNREAARLHLWHTHYRTPNGFDTWGQVTTAHDLAELTRTAMHRRAFARVVRTRSWTAFSADGRFVHHWNNINKLLWSYPTVDGVKTGTTPGAGACLVSSAHWHGKWVIAVNLGSSARGRFSDGAALLNYGLSVAADQPSTR